MNAIEQLRTARKDRNAYRDNRDDLGSELRNLIDTFERDDLDPSSQAEIDHAKRVAENTYEGDEDGEEPI